MAQLHVLIIESDPTHAKKMKKLLRQAGCEVNIKGDGVSGLEAFKKHKPDAAVVSAEASNMNGYAVCNWVKKDTSISGIPLMLTSSKSNDKTFEQHRKLRYRAEAYLVKPFKEGEFLHLFGMMLSSAGADAAATAQIMSASSQRQPSSASAEGGSGPLVAGNRVKPLAGVFESDGPDADSILKLLSSSGVNVRINRDGSDAAQWVAEHQFDFLVVAAELPRVSGFAVCNKIRRSPGGENLPIMLLSKNATEETFAQHRKLRAAANAYLKKPFTRDAFLTVLSTMVSLPGNHALKSEQEKTIRILNNSPVRCLSCGADIPVKPGWEGNLTKENLSAWCGETCTLCGSGLFGLK